VIEGTLVRGLGKAASFTQLDWVRRQFVELAGIDPYPETLNLKVVNLELKSGEPMQAEGAAYCSARCYPVRIEGRVPGAIVVPEVPGYPDSKVEVVASLPLREHLSLEEGALVRLELCRPLAAKAVIFDLDGTLVDSVGAYLEVARIAAKEHELEVTEEQVRSALCSGTNFWKGVIPADRHDGEAVRKALFAHASREWPRVLREHGRPFPGLANTLDALKRMGLKLGIVSGARPEVMELLLEVRDRFDAVVLGPDVSQRKPHPEGLEKCLQKLGMKPDDAIYVGDTPVDLQASRAAGMRAVGVLCGAGDSALLSAHEPVRLIASHSKLPGILLS
jgi:phosphoglycolate phosphatase